MGETPRFSLSFDLYCVLENLAFFHLGSCAAAPNLRHQSDASRLAKRGECLEHVNGDQFW